MSNPSTLKDVKEESRERFSADLENLKSSFSQLKNDVAHLIKTSVGTGKASASVVKDQAGSAVGDAKEKMHALTDRGQKQVEELGEIIGERPLTSALVAFGVGFLVAKLLSRR